MLQLLKKFAPEFFGYLFVGLYVWWLYHLRMNRHLLSSFLFVKVYLPTAGIGIVLAFLVMLNHSRHLWQKVDPPLIEIRSANGKTTRIGGPRHFPRTQASWLKALHSSNKSIRGEGMEALVAQGRDVLPMLFYHCREEGEDYREAVKDVIDRVHPDGLLNALVEALEDEELDLHSQWQVCNVLRDMRANAAPAVPTLIKVLRRNLPLGTADDALGEIGPASALSLAELMLDTTADKCVRVKAADALCDCCFPLHCSLGPCEAEKELARNAYTKIIENQQEDKDFRATIEDALRGLDKNCSVQEGKGGNRDDRWRQNTS